MESLPGSIESLVDMARPYIESYGPLVISLGMLLETLLFVGFLVPGFNLLLAGGFLSAEGTLNPWTVWPLTVAGGVCGDQLSFLVGRFFGNHVLDKHRDRTAELRRVLDEDGRFLLLTYHYSSVLRPLVPIVSGYTRYNWARFALLDSIGISIWISIFFWLGYVAYSLFANSGWVMLIVGIAAWALTAYIIWRVWIKSGSSGRKSEQKAQNS